MPFTTQQRLMSLGVPTPLAKELGSQLDTGVYNVYRLIEMGMDSGLAKIVVTQPFDKLKAVRLGMVPAVATLVAQGGQFPVPTAVYLPAGAGAPAVAIGARVLVSGYSGSLIRVQKGGDVGSGGTTFDVPVLANGLSDDAAAISWAAGAEMRVAILYDQSGNGRNIVPTAWALMPLYDPAGLYGTIGRYKAFNSIMFDGWFSTPSTRFSKSAPIVVPGSLNRNNISVFDVFDPKSALYNQSFWSLTPTSFLGMGTAAAETGLYVGEFTNKSSGIRPRQKFQTVGVTISTGNGMKIIQDGQLVSAAASSSLVLTGGWLGVGSSGPSGTSDFIDTSNRLAFVIYPAGLSDANATAVRDALDSTFGLLTSPTIQVIGTGDSNWYGAQVNGSSQQRTLTRESRNQSGLNADWWNMALSSQRMMGGGGQIALAPSREELLLALGSYTKRVLIVQGGGNDLADGTAAATLYAATTAYIADMRTKGATRVLICTVPTRSVFTSGPIGDEWSAYNALVLANSAGADYVVDLAGWFVGERANFGNSTYWQGDATHWTGFVNHELAPLVVAGL